MKHADQAANVRVFPVADGGEGTLDALMSPLGGQLFKVEVANAVYLPVSASYGIISSDAGRSAVLESAQAVGLGDLEVSDALPRQASSYGLGMLAGHALNQGVDELVVALGGSVTTDGGAGLLQALGARLFDSGNHEIPIRGNPLWSFDHADFSGLPDFSNVRVRVLCDVDNPMTGPNGAAAVFGPQKGATPQQVQHLEAQQRRWARAMEGHFGVSVAQARGAGAAGGLGGALLALGGQIEPGFDYVAGALGLEAAIAEADLVITGEGSIDSQSAHGKVPSGVGRLARAAGVIVVGLAGRVGYPLGELEGLLDGIFCIHSEPLTLEQAVEPDRTAAGISRVAGQVVKLVSAAAGNATRHGK